MQEPFDIEINGTTYSVFPEEEGIYTIFKEGIEHMKIQKDDNDHWLKLDPETETPLFEEDEEASRVGRELLRNIHE
ncbi:MAG TPA: hypothetical protein VGE26_05190 [Sphingobacteriaceae bacterium]